MYVWHFSPLQYLGSIQRWGLKVTHASGKRQVIWLCTNSLLNGIGPHIAQHQGVAVADLVLFMLHLPRCWLIRRRPGIYTCDVDIPATAIVSITFLGRVPRNALV